MSGTGAPGGRSALSPGERNWGGVGGRPFPESPSSGSAPRAGPGRILGAREKARQTASPLEKAVPFWSQMPRAGGGAGWCV